MSQALDQVIEQIRELSLEDKKCLRILLDDASFDRDAGAEITSSFGWAQGQITIGGDFDKPIDDFKEYVE